MHASPRLLIAFLFSMLCAAVTLADDDPVRQRLDQVEAELQEADRAVKANPKSANAYDARGSAYFRLGHVAESIADFDRAIELDAAREPGHWRRGISYYYAGRYDEGQKQFEGYQTVDENDVENAVWRFLCMARGQSPEAARGSLLKIKNDIRIPMMQIYGLFAGEQSADDVLKAARSGDPTPAELNERLFYAYLYLGLYEEALGHDDRAREHITLAARDHLIGHYMWDVARVHVELLEKADAKNAGQQPPTRIVLIGHGPDHPYRTHCYLPDCELLARCLRQTPGVEAIVSRGWPEEKALLKGAAALVLHVQKGGDLLFDPAHRDQAEQLLKRGIGLAALHWGTGASPDERGERWLNAMGGHFDTSFARYVVEESRLRRGAAEHPVCRGWDDFDLRDEFYFKLQFKPEAVPVAVAKVAGQEYPIGWVYERPQSEGRSFGFVAGHFHDNFGIEEFRRLVVNGILWTAKVEVPHDGAPCEIEPADLELSEEFEKLNPKSR